MFWTKRVLIFAASAATSLMLLMDGTASAGKSCPKGSHFVGDSSGGVCIDNEDNATVVKVLR